jgi:hypothetical protein
MPELRTAKAKMYFGAGFGSSGVAAPALDDDTNEELTQGEQDGLDMVRSGVTYEQLRSYACAAHGRLTSKDHSKEPLGENGR